MKYRITINLSIVLCLLSSCGMNPTVDPTDRQVNDTPIELTNLSTRKDVDQQVAKQAKEILKYNDDLTAVKAVNTPDKLVVAIDIYHLQRLQLKKIEKKIQKKLEKEFPTSEVILSSDKKVFLELDKLEKKLQSDSLSKDKLAKKITKIIELSNEET